MIDIHCHILPGLDDGAQRLEEALEMARLASRDGITEMIATPHTKDGVYHNHARDILRAVEELQKTLDQERIPLTLHPGSEVHIHVEMIENLRTEEILPLCNQQAYVLLELPVLNLPIFTEDLLYELRIRGITPIIAHPERNAALRENPDRLRKWIDQGAVAQLTAGSLTGEFGERTKGIAVYMLQHQLAHVIASDGHNVNQRRPLLKEAYEIVATLMSSEVAMMYRYNAQAILNGDPCRLLQTIEQKKKRVFFKFFRK